MYFQRMVKPANRTYRGLLKNTISALSCKVPNGVPNDMNLYCCPAGRMPVKSQAFCPLATQGKFGQPFAHFLIGLSQFHKFAELPRTGA